MNIFAYDLHVAGVRSETRPLTGWAGDRRSVAAEHDAHMQLIAFPFQVFEELLHALHLAFSLAADVADLLRQILVGDGEVDSMAIDEEQRVLLAPVAAGFAPGFNRALGQRLAVVGNDEVGIVMKNIAEPFALRTGAEWMVEGKENRTNRVECSPTLLAAKVRTVGSDALVDDLHAAQALALAKRGFDRFDEAGSVVFPDHQPIEYHMKMVRPGFRKAVGFMEIEDFLAAPDPGEPAQQQRLEKGLVLLRHRCCDGEKDHCSCVAAMAQQVVGDAPRVKAARLNGAIGADRMAHFGEQKT